MVHVDRAAVIAAVRAVVASPDFGTTPPDVKWADDGEDPFYGRNADGGSMLWLQLGARTTAGTDQVTYDVGGEDEPDMFATEYSGLRRFTLSITCESDAIDDMNTAGEILERIRTRLEFWPTAYDALLAAGITVLESQAVQDTSTKWDGRNVTRAVLDLLCLSELVERDTSTLPGDNVRTGGGGEFFDDLLGVQRTEPEEP